MAYHAILVKNQVMASDIDSLNRSAVSGSALDNGFVFRLDSVSATSGEREVWSATQPSANGSTLNGLWMAASPENSKLTDADGTVFPNMNPNLRVFYNAAGDIVSAFRVQPGDVITLTAEAFTNAISTNTYANAGNSFQLTWGSAQTASALSFKLIETTYIPVGNGTLGSTQRITAYRLQCLAN